MLEKLYGDMYRLLPMIFLDGPQAWVTKLSAHRRDKNAEWVAGISAIHSKLNRDYRIPSYLRDVHDDFFDRVRVPPTLVYINIYQRCRRKSCLKLC